MTAITFIHEFEKQSLRLYELIQLDKNTLDYLGETDPGDDTLRTEMATYLTMVKDLPGVMRAELFHYLAYDSVGLKFKYTGEEYTVFTKQVAEILRQHNMDNTVIAAAFLNHILQQVSWISRELIFEMFNDESALLCLLSDLTPAIVSTNQKRRLSRIEKEKHYISEVVKRNNYAAINILLAEAIAEIEKIASKINGELLDLELKNKRFLIKILPKQLSKTPLAMSCSCLLEKHS